jgi:A/G-specific adenine glycosylase
LPWRQTRDPYRIVVSEVMLQQTQVDRVIPYYERFLKRFPNAAALAGAPLSAALAAWQGLGYNRRAKLLRECAMEVERTFQGTFPRTYLELQRLPGIGPYTAGAVMAFAYNRPVPFVETNVRTAYLRHFFKNTAGVPDREILRLVERTMDLKNPRAWYAALMDYGAHLKRSGVRLNAQSRHYAKQTAFAGSNRQVRGAIVRALVEGGRTKRQLTAELGFSAARVEAQLQKLISEGMVVLAARRYRLPS